MRKIMKIWQILMVLALLPAASILQAKSYYVATNGVDDTAIGRGESWALPYATISNGVAQAKNDGDVVNVANGVYVLATNIFVTTAITLRGQDRTNTIIQGQYPAITNRGLYIDNGEAIVEEFTITQFGLPTNTLANNGYGGGVYLNNGTLQACIISNNVGADKGGGVYQAAGMVSNCVIRFNTCRTYIHAGYGVGGGGLFAEGGQVWDCRIADNIAITGAVNAVGGGVGGGVGLSSATMVNSVVSNNLAYSVGGGVWANASIIINCTVANNSISTNVSRYGGGMYCQGATVIYGTFIRNNYSPSLGGGIVCGSGLLTMRNSEICCNTGSSYGGGIILAGGSLFMTNCVISNNLCVGNGGGIEAKQYDNGGITAVGCRIVNNRTTSGTGAGIQCGRPDGTSYVFDHCIIQGNEPISPSASANGAGIYLAAGCKSTFRNCLIADNGTTNTSASGGGIYIEAGGTNQIIACTIAGNSAYAHGGGVYLAGDGSDTFANCMIAANSLNASAADNNIYMTTAARNNAFYYSCSERLTNASQGNITAAPVFKNAASGDWRLQNGSPGINAGINEAWMATDTDLDGRARIDYFRRQVDMGAYEFLPAEIMFAFLQDMVGLLTKWRKPMDGLTEKARQLGIPLVKPRMNLALEIEARQAKDVKLWVNGQPVDEQAGQWPVSIRQGLNVIAMTAAADGQTPGLRLRIPNQPELETRWRVGAATAATNDRWLTAAFDDRSWKKAKLDKKGYLLMPPGFTGDGCFRQIVLWGENHYSGLPCLQPKVREWGFSEKSMETLFHVLYSPPPLTFPLEDYEFVLDVPKGFSLLEEKYDDDAKGGRLNRRPRQVTVEEVKHDRQPYTRYRFAFESAFVQANNEDPYKNQCTLIPLLLNEYKGATCKFYFRRLASGNLTELEQTLPVCVLPPLNGRMPKKVMISQYRSVPWLCFPNGSGQLFPEHFEAHMRQSLDVGFNYWSIAEGLDGGAHGKKMYDRVLARGGGVILSGPSSYPLHSGPFRKTTGALAKLMQAAPEFRARFFNGSANRPDSGQYCLSFVTREGAAQFKEAIKKDIGSMLNGAAEFKFIGFPKATIYWTDWEQQPWLEDYDGAAQVWRPSNGNFCFCENCKQAFRQYAKLPDTTDLSDDAIFKNYKREWSSFRHQLIGHMNGIVREACNELGLKYMFYDWASSRESFEACKGKIDIAFPGWPGDGTAVGIGTAETTKDFLVTQRSLDEVMTFFREKVGISQIMGQLFASVYEITFNKPGRNWIQRAGSTKDGFINAKSVKSMILRVVASFHGGVDLGCSVNRCAGQQYYIGEATRIISEYEDLFWSGERADQLAASEQIKYPNLLVLRKGKERLVLLFNEGSQPIRVILQNKDLASGQKAKIVGVNQVVERPEKMELMVGPEDVAIVHIQ